MAEGWTVPAGHIEKLAGAVIGAGRLLGTASPEAVADTLGWRAVRHFGGDDVRTDVGVPGGHSVVLRFVTQAGRRVFTEARVSLAEAQSTAGREFVVDAFADAAAALEPRFGRMTTDRPGARPMITWQLERIKESRLPWRRRFAAMTLELSPDGHGVDLAIRPGDEAARLAAAATSAAAQAETAVAAVTGSDGADAWADGDWDRFAAVLTAELADLEPGHSIILGGDDGHVQFVQFGEGDPAYIYADTVRDQSLDDGQPLTFEQQQRLAGLGWDAPPADPSPDDLAIWSYHLPWPARWSTYQRLAGMAAATLRDVHGVGGPADLALGGWGYDNTGPAPYPRLGLAADSWQEAPTDHGPTGDTV